MSVLENPEAREFEPEEPVPVPVTEHPTTAPAHKQVCKHCLRPVLEVDGAWVHWDARIDFPENPGFCLAELFIEPVIRWGWQTDGSKSDFTVGPAPKITSGGISA